MSKVLIIEDETSIAELEKDYMELSGFEVDSVSDGEEGLEKALNEDEETHELSAVTFNLKRLTDEMLNKI